MSKTPLYYTVTPSAVTDSMVYLKLLEQLNSAFLIWGLETHRSILLSFCPFSKQPYFTDQQLLEKGQMTKGTNSLASLSFLRNLYKLLSDSCAAFLDTSSQRPNFSFPFVGFEFILSVQEPEEHWAAWLALHASAPIEAWQIFTHRRHC